MGAPMLERLLPYAIALAALCAIVSAGAEGNLIWLHYIAKPLTTLLILASVWRAGNAPNARYRHAVMIGIAFSACGDVFIMLPETLLPSGFLFGLGSFLVAHLFFLRVPVLVYVTCLIAMTSQAVSRFLTVRTIASGFAAFGGIIFLLSDTLIAYNRFHARIIFASACILVTYYAALWLIAKSARSEHLTLP